MPTPKQKKAALNLLENLSKDKPDTIQKVLVDSGYSETISTTPSQVTRSKGFLQALEEAGVTDDKLTKIMNEGLEAMTYVKTERVEGVGKDRVKTEEVISVPNDMIRHKYLETAIRVKGLASPENSGSGDTYNTFIQQNNLDPNAPEAKALVDNTLDMLMQQTKAENNNN